MTTEVEDPRRGVIREAERNECSAYGSSLRQPRN